MMFLMTKILKNGTKSIRNCFGKSRSQQSEVRLKKPDLCLIISPNEMNKFLQTLIIAPITSTSKVYPTRIEIKGKETKGWVVIDQIRTVDRRRITKILENFRKRNFEN